MDGSENLDRDDASPAYPSGAFTKVFVNPVAPLYEIVERVIATMENGPDVVTVVGLPKRVYCFRHPEAIAQIFTDRGTGGTKYLPRVAWLHWFYRSGGFARPIDEVWRQRRRAVQPSFSHDALISILPAFQAVIEERVASWCAQLKGKREISVDIFRECWEIIVDANFRAFFSTKLGDRLAEVTSMSQFVERNFVQPLPLWLPLNRNRRFKRDGGGLRDLFADMLARRRAEGGGGKRDVLNLLIAEAQEGSSLSSDEAIVDEIASLYFGMCVMAVSLTWGMYLIASHAEVQNKMRIEADQFALSGTETRIRRRLGYAYTNQVFNEIARLLPPVWGLPRYTVEPAEIMGHRIPAKSVVVPMIYLAHRDPRFWPNPLKFDPDRFSPEGTTPEKAPAYFPYGLGVRKCTGANIAPTLMQLVLLAILSQLEMEFVPRFAGDPVQEFGFEIIPRDGLPIVLRQRNNKSS